MFIQFDYSFNALLQLFIQSKYSFQHSFWIIQFKILFKTLKQVIQNSIKVSELGIMQKIPQIDLEYVVKFVENMKLGKIVP